jgi:metal transporter CNNM
MASRRPATTAVLHSFNGYTSARSTVLGLAKISFLGLSQLSFASATPLKRLLHVPEDVPDDEDDPNLWIYLGTTVILVLLGGAFAGLTIA